jgi:hypothetical protein
MRAGSLLSGVGVSASGVTVAGASEVTIAPFAEITPAWVMAACARHGLRVPYPHQAEGVSAMLRLATQQSDTLETLRSSPLYPTLASPSASSSSRSKLLTAIAHARGVFLLDEMGVGKTLQALLVALLYRLEWCRHNQLPKRPVLIVATRAVYVAWKVQMECHAGQLSPACLRMVEAGLGSTDDQRKRLRNAVRAEAHFVLVTYGKLAHAFKHGNVPELFDTCWSMVLFDEIHNIRNGMKLDIVYPGEGDEEEGSAYAREGVDGSLAWNAVMRLRADIPFRIGMSGTLYNNHPNNVACTAQAVFRDHRVLADPFFWNDPRVYRSESKLSALRDAYFLRRTSEGMGLSMPPCTIHPVMVTLSEAGEWDLYVDALRRVRSAFQHALGCPFPQKESAWSMVQQSISALGLVNGYMGSSRKLTSKARCVVELVVRLFGGVQVAGEAGGAGGVAGVAGVAGVVGEVAGVAGVVGGVAGEVSGVVRDVAGEGVRGVWRGCVAGCVVGEVTDTIDPASHPDPTHTDPTHTDPTQPDPTQPDPTHPNPTHPDPTHPDPTHPDPTHPDPTHPDPTHPDPTHPNPTHPTPTQPNPASHPDPTHPEPTHFDPTHTDHTDHTDPTHTNPTHTDHTDPTHTDHTDPTHTDHTDPTHTDPTHTDPPIHTTQPSNHQRVIIVSRYVKVLHMLQHFLNMALPHHASKLYTGALNIPERLSLLQQFEQGQFSIMLLSLRAGNEGVNFTCCQHLISYDGESARNPFTDRDQVFKRIHRLDQTKPCHIYTITAQDTIDVDMPIHVHRVKYAQSRAFLDSQSSADIDTDASHAEGNDSLLASLLRQCFQHDRAPSDQSNPDDPPDDNHPHDQSNPGDPDHVGSVAPQTRMVPHHRSSLDQAASRPGPHPPQSQPRMDAPHGARKRHCGDTTHPGPDDLL